jgi:hypothetical protein
MGGQTHQGHATQWLGSNLHDYTCMVFIMVHFWSNKASHPQCVSIVEKSHVAWTVTKWEKRFYWSLLVFLHQALDLTASCSPSSLILPSFHESSMASYSLKFIVHHFVWEFYFLLFRLPPCGLFIIFPFLILSHLVIVITDLKNHISAACNLLLSLDVITHAS